MPAAEAAQPRRIILANPRSFRMASHNRLQRIDQLAQRAAVPLHAVHDPSEIAAVLSAASLGAHDLLIIIGGDGTLQAAVSELAPQAAAGLAPRLCMLGGGRTNFTARDLGSHQRLLGSLQHLLDTPAAWREVERPTLRISGSEHGELHGFFIAGALVDAVIRDCHEFRARSRGWLATGHAATPWRLAQLAVLGLVGRKRFGLPELQIEAEGLGALDGTMRILLITSLLHHTGLLNPYAERGDGAVRFTAIAQTAAGFWRRLPALLGGRFAAQLQPENGYLSGSTQRLSLSGLASICLDGQEYELNPQARLLIEAGPMFRFLQP